MSVELECLFQDNEAEDSLLRNIEDFNTMFNDAKQWSEKTCRSILTDEELERYESCLPGTKLSTRRAKVIQLLKANPCLRSIDPNVLYQRVSFFLWKYGEKSEKTRRRRKTPILRSVQTILAQDPNAHE